MRKRRVPINLPISKYERALGVKLIIFDGYTLKEAHENKKKWFAKRKYFTALREKQKVTQGRGVVVGPWTDCKVYVAYIPTKKMYQLEQKQEPTSAGTEVSH